MSNIINNQSDFLAYIADEAMSNGNLSIRGVARCCGVADKSILNGGSFNSSQLAETLEAAGFEAGSLASDGFNPQAVWLTIEYFAYESKAKAVMAKQLARTFGAIGVMTTMEKLTKAKFPENAIGPVQADPVLEGIGHISAAIDCIFGSVGLAPELVAGVKVEALSATYPQYQRALEAAKGSLKLEAVSAPMTPTRLAEIWNSRTGENLNARSMNTRLESAGFQRKTGLKSPPWEAIGVGKDHSFLHFETAKGHGKTVIALHWYESTIEALLSADSRSVA